MILIHKKIKTHETIGKQTLDSYTLIISPGRLLKLFVLANMCCDDSLDPGSKFIKAPLTN
jgi:hypothetical protein